VARSGDAFARRQPAHRPRCGGPRPRLHPDGLGKRVVDLPSFSAHVLSRLRREAAMSGDPALTALHDELAGYPGVCVEESWTDPPGLVGPLRAALEANTGFPSPCQKQAQTGS